MPLFLIYDHKERPMKRIVSVKFGASGQIELYACEDPFVIQGDFALVDTEQGLYMGRVMRVHETCPEEANPETLPLVLRKADPQDMQVENDNREMLFKAKKFCDQRVRERKLDMKLVDVETLFDSTKLIFYFTAPTRIDFRELVKDLVREYHTRIELRQIGVRHETQMLGALGSCGMTCCCRRFLRKFMPVTIKMAKEQNLFLNPTKISGICGRLLCCLSYEQENYDIFHRSCPRLGKRYQTTKGPVKVLRANLFRNSVVVLSDQNEELEFTLDEWKELEPRRPDTPAGVESGPQAGRIAGSDSGPPLGRTAGADNSRPPALPGSSGLMVIEADPYTVDAMMDSYEAYGEAAAGGTAPMPRVEDTPPAQTGSPANPDGNGTPDDSASRRAPHRHKRKRKK